ncbi:MAG: CvpA family protein [Chloroflexota bacterium]
MIELSALLWVMAIFFAIIGFLRGWTKEIVSTAGIILGLFALFQFDTLIRGTLLANVGRDQVFIVQAGLFIIIVYFAYQTRALYGNERGPGRDALQESVLGGFLGFLNGYLIWGSIWYFLDINEYPLAPYVIAPAPGSPSDQARSLLPLVVLGGGVTGSGDLLAIAVIVLFIVVLIMI